MKRSATIFLICWLFGASGCAVNVDVSPFHTMTPDMKGKSSSIIPRDNQMGSLDFLQYGRRVAVKLGAHGFRPLSDPKQSDFHVFLSYSIDGGRAVTKTKTTRGEIKEGHWVGEEPNRIWVPAVRGITDVSTSTEIIYRKTFTLEIVDARKSRGGNVYKVFEAKVLNSGRNNSFLAVSDCMIEGLFSEFPGISGRAMTYVIDAETCMPRGEHRLPSVSDARNWRKSMRG